MCDNDARPVRMLWPKWSCKDCRRRGSQLCCLFAVESCCTPRLLNQCRKTQLLRFAATSGRSMVNAILSMILVWITNVAAAWEASGHLPLPSTKVVAAAQNGHTGPRYACCLLAWASEAWLDVSNIAAPTPPSRHTISSTVTHSSGFSLVCSQKTNTAQACCCH